MAKRVEIQHIDDVRGRQIPNGWYRVPSFGGLTWVYYKNGENHTEVQGQIDEDKNLYELWVGNAVGNTETLSYHKLYHTTEEAAEKWIRKHRYGWV